MLRPLGDLTAAPTATYTEALDLIGFRALMGLGSGYGDAHLLASTALTGVGRLWTRDECLAAVALELELAFDEKHRG